MHELTRDEVQDLLPDLLHGRLDAAVAAQVRRAVDADPDLASELATLRAVHGTARRAAPLVDIGRIVAALPPAPPVAAPVIDELAARRAVTRPLISRTFARAAALLVVVGGGTLVTLMNRPGAVTPVVPAVVASESVSVAGDQMQLGLGVSTDELSVEQLRALEEDIRTLDGVPSAEPESGTDFMAGEGA